MTIPLTPGVVRSDQSLDLPVLSFNPHGKVWVNHRGRYGLSSGARERLSTEEGLAALNSMLCYPSQTRFMWSAAMLYYCAVKGEDMGFGELHKHLIKYVRCPAKRYWCVFLVTDNFACVLDLLYTAGSVPKEIVHHFIVVC